MNRVISLHGVELEVDYDYTYEAPEYDYPGYRKCEINSVLHEGDELIDILSSTILGELEDKCIELES